MKNDILRVYFFSLDKSPDDTHIGVIPHYNIIISEFNITYVHHWKYFRPRGTLATRISLYIVLKYAVGNNNILYTRVYLYNLYRCIENE